MARVLVTNAEYKHALAIVRSLGRRRIAVDCMSHRKDALSFRSKYCQRQVLCTNPLQGPVFGQELEKVVQSGVYDVVLPVGLIANYEASLRRAELGKHSHVPVADFAKMTIACHKGLTLQMASKIGIPTPKTVIPQTLQEAVDFSSEVGFPVFLKKSFGSGGRGNVVARCEHDVKVHYGSMVSASSRPLVQEYVKGCGFGYFALMNDGIPVAELAHQRLHEYPPGGGISAMATSIRIPELMRMGRSILEHLRWTGVAMVEFRGGPDRKDLKLLEVNPKFWGSLDLAIAAGVDFPHLTFRMAMGEELECVGGLPGVTYRWVLPDFLYSLRSGRIGAFALNFLRPSIRNDIDLDDLRPVACNAKRILLEALRSVRNEGQVRDEGPVAGA